MRKWLHSHRIVLTKSTIDMENTYLAGFGGPLGYDVWPYKLHSMYDVLGLGGGVDRGKTTCWGLLIFGHLVPARLPELMESFHWKNIHNST